MRILINGGCGFLGSNLASYGIKNGYDITVLDNLSRLGASKNLEWLQSLGKVSYIATDTRNKNDVEIIILYHKKWSVRCNFSFSWTSCHDDIY